MYTANLNVIFISFLVSVASIQAPTLDEAFRAQAHYKHAAISSVHCCMLTPCVEC